MQCEEFKRSAEGWMEGEQPATVAGHLRECPRCRGLIADLECIRAAAPQLADDAEPPPSLWNTLRAQLEAEGLIREPARHGWLSPVARWLASPLRPVLAGTALALAIAVGLLIRLNNAPPSPQKAWIERNNSMLSLASTQLRAEQKAVSTPSEHNPAVKATLQRNLDIVDNSITMCEKTVQEEPTNEVARNSLFDAYQQKADLLATLAERGR